MLQCRMAYPLGMPTNDPAATAAAELDLLDSAYTRAERRRDEARDALHVAMIRHLMARSAPPGQLADHTPYDRNWVRVRAKEAGVPPLRGPDAGPKPVYDPGVMEEAFVELDRLSAAFDEAERAIVAARGPLQEAIIWHYMHGTLRPVEIAAHVSYDLNHVGLIVREWKKKFGDTPPVRA